MTTKTCNRCDKQKELKEFFKDKNNKTDGHYSICKECKHSNTSPNTSPNIDTGVYNWHYTWCPIKHTLQPTPTSVLS